VTGIRSSKKRNKKHKVSKSAETIKVKESPNDIEILREEIKNVYNCILKLKERIDQTCAKEPKVTNKVNVKNKNYDRGD
jgi:hypothetical protein